MIKPVIGFIYLILFFPLTLLAQQVEIPAEVKARFTEDFTRPSTTTWIQDERGNYKANFVHQSHTKTASYNTNGVWQFTETKLAPDQVPFTVLESLSDNYKTFDIKQIKKLETLTGISFKIKVRMKNSVYEIEVDPSGKIKSKRKLPETEDDKKTEDDEKEDKKDHGLDHQKKEKSKKEKKERD